MRTIAYLAVGAFACLVTVGYKLTANTVAMVESPSVLRSTLQPTVALQLKFHVGQLNTYHTTMTETGTVTQPSQPAKPIDMTVDSTVTRTVQSIDPQTGAATIVTSTVVNSKSINGKDVDAASISQIPATTTIVEPNGVVDGSDTSTDLGFYAANGRDAVGGAWSRDAKDNVSGMNCHTSYTLADTSCGTDHHTVADITSQCSGSLLMQKVPGCSTVASGTLTGSQSSSFDTTLGVLRDQASTTHTVMALVSNTQAPETIDVAQTVTTTLVSSN